MSAPRTGAAANGVAAPDAGATRPVERARLRQALYRLLGASALYPHGDRLLSLRDAAQAFMADRQHWGEEAYAGPLRGLLAQLAMVAGEPDARIEEEYVRLFRLKPAAPPYETYYRDPEGQARGMLIADLEGEYAAHGLALSPDMKELPDHVAVELEFMSCLCRAEVLALEAEVDVEVHSARAAQHAFLRRHLGRWFPRFAERTRKAEPPSLYGGWVEAGASFIDHDRERLEQSMEA